MSSPPAIDRDPSGSIRLTFQGELTIDAARNAWDATIEATRQAKGQLTIDLGQVTTCDGVGLGLLTEIRQQAESAGVEVKFDSASPELDELLTMARRSAEPESQPPKPAGAILSVGNATAFLIDTLKSLIAFVGALAAATRSGVVSVGGVRRRDFISICTRVGADAVPVVSFLGLLVGYILSVQALKALEAIGTTSLVPLVVGFATFREFGALIAGIILAGRTGAAFAAEIGTMKITEELDAYTTFGLDPMAILVFPRVLAAAVVMPFLAVFSVVLGVIGGVGPLLSQGYTMSAYLTAVFDSVAIPDLVQALTKALVFGLLVGILGCFHGMRTASGADAVGVSTTRAVVWGIVAILVADSILSSIFYNLGY